MFHCSSRFTRAQTSSVIPRVNIGIVVQEVVRTEHNANVSAAAARGKVAATISLSSKLSVSEIQSLLFQVMNASSFIGGVRSIGRQYGPRGIGLGRKHALRSESHHRIRCQASAYKSTRENWTIYRNGNIVNVWSTSRKNMVDCVPRRGRADAGTTAESWFRP